jgi:hypothetical protein
MRFIGDAARLARTSSVATMAVGPGLGVGVGGSGGSRLPRARLIEHIMRVNRGASAAFLEGFSDAALRDYLDHLDFAHEPDDPDGVLGVGAAGAGESGRVEAAGLRVVTRGARGWVRRGDTSAVNSMPGDW